MDIRDRQSLTAKAESDLRAAQNPQRLILTYMGTITLATLLLAAVSVLLEQQIANTGGLSGLSTRSTLTTIQLVLTTGLQIALPFWQFGYTVSILALARRESAGPKTLLAGFQHFGPFLRLTLLRGLIFGGLAMLLLYPLTMLLIVTPVGRPLIALLTQQINAADPNAVLQIEDAVLMRAMLPILAVCFAVYLPVVAPLYYRLRMASFALAENPRAGAIAAIRESIRRMRCNRVALLRLDLSFWWYYALMLLALLLCYADRILAALHVSLPISDTAAYFLFYVFGLAVQFAVSFWAQNRITLTYAAAYDACKGGGSRPVRPAAPERQPWVY